MFQFHEDEVAENTKPIFNNLTQNGSKYTIFLCSICRLAFTERELLKQHMINVGTICSLTILKDEVDTLWIIYFYQFITFTY